MDTGLQPPSIQDPGFGVPSNSNVPGHINYTMPGADAFAQSASQASLQGLVSGISGQDFFMNPYGDPLPGNESVFSSMNGQPSGYFAQSLSNNENFANTAGLLDTSINTTPASSNQYGDIARQWSTFSYPASGQPHAGTAPQNSYYFPGFSQPISLNQMHHFRESYTQSLPGSVPQVMQQAPASTSASSNIQPPPNVGVAAVNSGVSLRQARHFSPFPLSGVSLAPSQQRRHHRTNSLASAPLPTAGQPVRTSPQHQRVRARPANALNISSSQHPSSQPPGNQAIPTTTTTATTTGNTPSTPRAREHLAQAISQQQQQQHQPQQHQHQPASLNRSAQLRTLLRNMRAGGAQALQIYEESLLQGSRFTSDLDAHTSSPPSKGLDAPQETRPEPKETEELTVNLECKICMSQLVDTVMLPCGHAILCRWCADQHIPSVRGYPKGKASCPMCREPVKQKHRIYFP